MKKHICRQCGSTFEYCRGCLLSPISHKDAGFCSKECYEASKMVAVSTVETEPIVEDVITVEIEESIVENNNESLIDDVKPIEENVLVEVEAEMVDTPIIETTTPTVKNDTYNAYKKKKRR